MIGNYRGTSLGCRFFFRLLARRLGKFCEENIFTEAQRDFRRKRKCADLVLRRLCKIRKRERRCYYLAFLDISMAYNSVVEGLWHKMR